MSVEGWAKNIILSIGQASKSDSAFLIVCSWVFISRNEILYKLIAEENLVYSEDKSSSGILYKIVEEDLSSNV